MTVTYQLNIENYLSIKSMTLDLSEGITGFVGPNAAGKTSVIKAIEGILDGSHDLKKIKDGEERSEIRLEELHDGEILRSVSRVQTQKGATIKGKNLPRAITPKKYISQLIDDMAVNPIRLIQDDPVKYLKKHLPAKALPEDIENMTREAVPFDLEKNAFIECEKQCEYFGQVRRKTYQEMRHAQEVVDELKQELPEIPEINFSLEEYTAQRDKIIADSATIDSHNKQRDELERRKEELLGRIQGHNNNLMSAENKIKDLVSQIEKIKENQKAVYSMMKTTKDDLEPIIQKLSDTKYKSKKDLQTRFEALEHQKTKVEEAENIKRRHKQLDEKEKIYLDTKETYNLEDGLYKYYAYELPKVLISRAKLPVEGIEFREDGLYVGDRHIQLMSTSEQVTAVSQIVAAICKQKGQIVVCLDGLESLLPDNRKKLLEAMAKTGLRILYTKCGEVENEYEIDVSKEVQQ